MDEAAVQRRWEGRRQRRRRRSLYRAAWLAVLAGAAVAVVVLSRLAVARVAPWVRAEFAPFLRNLALAERSVIRESELPAMLPGIPLYPKARYDELLTMTYWLRDPEPGAGGPVEGFPELTFVFDLRADPSEAVAWYDSHLRDWVPDAGGLNPGHPRRYLSAGRILDLLLDHQSHSAGRRSQRLILRYWGPSPGHARAAEARRAVRDAFLPDRSSAGP